MLYAFAYAFALLAKTVMTDIYRDKTTQNTGKIMIN